MSKKREYSRFGDIPHQRVNGPVTDGCTVLEDGIALLEKIKEYLRA